MTEKLPPAELDSAGTASAVPTLSARPTAAPLAISRLIRSARIASSRVAPRVAGLTRCLGRVRKAQGWRAGNCAAAGMGHRGELSDRQWARLGPHLPPERPATVRPNVDHRRIVDGILWR